ALTVFVNYKVYDYKGQYIGATGVGLTIDAVTTMMERYSQRYRRNIYFCDQKGEIVLRSAHVAAEAKHLRDLMGQAGIANDLLQTKESNLSIERNGAPVHLNTRFIPELGWHLIVEQSETPMTRGITRALHLNLALCFAVTLLIISLIYLSICRYQRRIDTLFQEEQELRCVTQRQKEELAQQHEELKASINEVDRLSGLLPICSSCKKIRDDQGYWSQVESYIQRHSGAQFSHSLCPDCFTTLYPDISSRYDEMDTNCPAEESE
ncbi:MAG: cache domain-containing protein, partial [Planctomycetota bacterium]